MATKDHAFRGNKFVTSVQVAAKTASGNGTGVDTAGYESVAMVPVFGTWTDGTHTYKLQDSPDNVTFTDVVAAQLDGTITAVSSAAGNNATQKQGYKGLQRYVRAVLTTAGTTTGAVSGALIVLSDPHTVPSA
jgi:hypothetical protein